MNRLLVHRCSFNEALFHLLCLMKLNAVEPCPENPHTSLWYFIGDHQR